LYLIHWPANKKQFGLEAGGINAETWQAFEDLYKQGRVRAIGLSNFLTHHIQALYETATVNPQVNQIECHPGFLQQDTVSFCLDNDILPEAWSPLGRRAVLDNRVLAEIGTAHQKTAAQIALRWELQHNVVPLPKTVHKKRMIENANLFDFELSSVEMQRIDDLPFMGQGKNPDTIDF
jgi:diketogulonate reductase-like aldo/keto reductase